MDSMQTSVCVLLMTQRPLLVHPNVEMEFLKAMKFVIVAHQRYDIQHIMVYTIV